MMSSTDAEVSLRHDSTEQVLSCRPTWHRRQISKPKLSPELSGAKLDFANRPPPTPWARGGLAFHRPIADHPVSQYRCDREEDGDASRGHVHPVVHRRTPK